MSAEIKVIKETRSLYVFEAKFKIHWVTFKVVKKKDVWIKADDAFAAANGFRNLQEMKNREPGFKRAYENSTKDKDGSVWVLYNPASQDFLMFQASMFN